MNQKRRMKMMKWPEHIKRMHEEEIELALKIDRLNEFINGTKFMSLSPLQQRLLEAQQSAMYSYLKILRIRIEVEQDNYRNENDAQSVESYSSRLRSEEPTSELQSLMRISYAVFCLNKKK